MSIQTSCAPRRSRVSADVGETFTDVAVFSEQDGGLRLGKVLSTPGKLADGIQAGLNSAGGAPRPADHARLSRHL